MADRMLVRGRFEDFGAFEHALKALKESGTRHYEAYGPANLAELEDLMPRTGSGVRLSATGMAIIGLVTFFLTCVLTSLIYKLVVGGKPPVSNVPYVIVGYEGTILLGALGTVAAVIMLARLGLHLPPPNYDPRTSGDSFGIQVECSPRECQRVAELLRNAGAVETDEQQR